LNPPGENVSRPIETPVEVRERNALACALPAILLLISWAAPSIAIDWERMVMPGPLAAAHEKLEKDCSGCHQAFAAEAQRSLCLACHEPVAADLAEGKGFHSQNALAATGQCKSCHPDHMGREANIMGMSTATFDHSQTDYALRGRHEGTACASCHRPDQKRRDTATDCVECHRNDDAHQGALSTDCAKCHDETRWDSTRFDHSTTKYSLTGAHEKTSCMGCHVGQRYEGTPQDCVSCHAVDDAHAGRFGTNCASCHNTATWKKKSFDHKRESGFALGDAHNKVACATCHREPPGKRKLPETCTGCHASDDVHSGRFGDACQTCHSGATWNQARFDHGKEASFELRGAHSKVECNSCHTQRISDGQLPKDCYGCHRADDVHQGNLGRDCADCHNEASFAGRIKFDHELTNFPLLGLHAMAACESCHRDHSFEKQDVACQSCHASGDVHKGALGAACEQCHNPNAWTRWRFDHDKTTDFPLSGAHETLDCSTCHRTTVTKKIQMSDDCIDCHRSKDVHRGGFGRECQSCHSDKAWKPATFGRRRGVRR